MRKVFFCGVILFLAVASSAVFAGRAEISAALNSYEAVVVEAERLAGIPLVAASDFAAIDERTAAATTAIAAVANDREWLLEDAKRSADLRARFNQAMATIAQNLLKY